MDSVLREQMERGGGRMTLAAYMELALYHPEFGYYHAPERRPGRGGDFLTSPEASPLFGITLARQIVECWERLGSPERFDIREYGSGVGGLAYDILAGIDSLSPELFAATTYRLVERNRHRQSEALTAFRDLGLIDKVADESDASLEPITGMIIANEVADAFPAHRLVFRKGQFSEHWIELGEMGLDWRVAELSLGGQRAVQQLVEGGVDPVEGGIYDVSPAAAEWFAGAAGHLERGYTLVIDYGYPAPELYSAHRLTGTLRAYHEHTVTDTPFGEPGQHDLTIHVDFSALQRTGEGAALTLAGLTTQGAALASLGLGEHLLQLQNEPGTRMDEYLATQAVVTRLIDPGGLGRFRVQVMAKDAPIDPPLRIFRDPPPPF